MTIKNRDVNIYTYTHAYKYFETKSKRWIGRDQSAPTVGWVLHWFATDSPHMVCDVLLLQHLCLVGFAQRPFPHYPRWGTVFSTVQTTKSTFSFGVCCILSVVLSSWFWPHQTPPPPLLPTNPFIKYRQIFGKNSYFDPQREKNQRHPNVYVLIHSIFILYFNSKILKKSGNSQ